MSGLACAEELEKSSNLDDVKNEKLLFDQQKIIEELGCDDPAIRSDAENKFNSWVKQSPSSAFKLLYSLISNATEPEVRERSMMLLKDMAIADYDQIGDGYAGLQLSSNPLMVDVPNKGKLACVELSSVLKGGPADQAGLLANDKLVAVDGSTQKDHANYNEIIRKKLRDKGAGTRVVLGILRNGKYMEFTVKLLRRIPNLDQISSKQMMMMAGRVRLGGSIDPETMKTMMEDDKNGDAFFYEWLKTKKLAFQEK